MTQIIPRIIADFEVQLSTAIAAGGTSFSISSVTDDDGNTIPNGLYCFTIDNGSSAKEYLMGTLVGTAVSSVVSVSRQGVKTSGAARAHRVGASVILTDFLAIQVVADILRGATTLDGTAPLSYDSTPSLSDGKQLATVAYVLSIVTGGTVYFSSQIITGTAGETLASGDSVYFKESDQRWWKTSASTSSTFTQVRLGVAQGTALAGASVQVLLSGLAANFTSLTPGAKYYLSNTSGAVASSAGTTEVFIGTAVNSTTILWSPNFIYTPTAAEKSFLSAFAPAVSGMVFDYAGSSIPSGFLDCDGSLVSRTTYATLFAAIGTTWGAGDASTTFALPDLRGRATIGAGTGSKIYTFASRSSDTITATGMDNLADNSIQTGQAVLYHTSSGVMTGLTNDTTYYLIRVAYNQFKLATTLANAIAGTAISLSGDGSGTQIFTLTFTARTLGQVGGEETHALRTTEMPAHTHAVSAVHSAGSDVTSDGITHTSVLSGTVTSDSTGGSGTHVNMMPFAVMKKIIKT